MSTATRFCRICKKEIESNSWRSVVFGGEHICQRCYYELKPRFSPIVIADVSGYSLYSNSEKINGVLQSFLSGRDKKLGPVLFSYAAKLFYLRFHNYLILPLPEDEAEGDENITKEIFAPFGFRVLDAFREDVVEKDGDPIVRLSLAKGIPLNKNVILFRSKPVSKDVKIAFELVKKAGARNVLCFFLVGS